MVKKFFVILLLILSYSVTAISSEVEFIRSGTSEFNPTRGEKHPLSFKLEKDAEVSLNIYTSDGDLVTTLTQPEEFKPGNQKLFWDGTDAQGTIVPDEAYIPVILAKFTDGKTFQIDPRNYSGGETIEDLHIEITPDREIAYQLPAPSRVLIRLGIKNGPMMRSLANWLPKAAGKNIQRWNGFDSDNLIDLRTHERLSILVTAYKLPENAIITVGNPKQNYVDYRLEKEFPTTPTQNSDKKLERAGTRIARNYYLPHYKDRDPEVFMAVENTQKKTSNGIPIISDSMKIKVDIPAKDIELVQDSLYEVAFFVDNEFASEEEQGYMPLTWIYKPTGLAPGDHILTVNISSLSGQMGVKSLMFNVPENEMLEQIFDDANKNISQEPPRLK